MTEICKWRQTEPDLIQAGQQVLARRTIQGYEALRMMRKGQVHKIFDLAACC